MKRFFLGFEIILVIIFFYSGYNFLKNNPLDEIEIFVFPIFLYLGLSLFGVIFANTFSETKFFVCKYLLICSLIFVQLLCPRYGTIIDIAPIFLLVTVVANWNKYDENSSHNPVIVINKRKEFLYYLLNFGGCAIVFMLITLLVISKKEQQENFYSQVFLFAGIAFVFFGMICIYFLFFDKKFKYSKTVKILLITANFILFYVLRKNIFEYSEKLYWSELLLIFNSLTIQNLYLGKYKNVEQKND